MPLPVLLSALLRYTSERKMSHNPYTYNNGGPGSDPYDTAFLDEDIPFEAAQPLQYHPPTTAAPQFGDDFLIYESAGDVTPMQSYMGTASAAPFGTRPGGTLGSGQEYPMDNSSHPHHQKPFDLGRHDFQSGLYCNPENLLYPQQNEFMEQAAIPRHNMVSAVSLSLEGIGPRLESKTADNNNYSRPDSSYPEITSRLCQSKRSRVEKSKRHRRQAKKSVNLTASSASQTTRPALPGQQSLHATTIGAICLWMAKKPGVIPTERDISRFSDLYDDSLESISKWLLRYQAGGQESEDTGYQTMTGSNTDVDIATVSTRRRAHCIRKAEKRPDQGRLEIRVKRDESRPYPCTSRCGKNFSKKAGWKRHEEMNYPPKSWSCPFYECHNRRKRVHFRRDKFGKHLRDVHPYLSVTRAFINKWSAPFRSNFSKQCLFQDCKKRLRNWKERIDHIGDHFKNDQWDMTQWRSADEEEQESDDADCGDTDDSGTDENSDSDSADDSEDSDDSDDFDMDRRLGHLDNRHSSGFDSNGRGHGTSTGSQVHGSRTKTFSGANNSSSRYQLSPSVQNFHIRVHENLATCFDNVITRIPNRNTLLPVTVGAEYLHLRVLGFLGCGSGARVDEVKIQGYKGTVARKLVRRSSLSTQRDVYREAKIMAQLVHPHVTRLVGGYSTTDTLTLLLLPVADCNLSQYLGGCSSGLTADVPIWEWFKCLSSGLHHIHEKGVRHRDIKPSNILVNNHRLLYSNFGSSNLVAEEESTGSGSADFTEQYAAPEVYRGERGRPADVFSLGCVFSEMVASLLRQPINHLRSKKVRNEWVMESNRWSRSEATRASVSPSISLILDCCEAMTRPQPKQRPTAAEILKRFSPCRCCQDEIRTEMERTCGSERVPGRDDSDTARDDSCYPQISPSLLICRNDRTSREKMMDRYLLECDPFSKLLITGKSQFEHDALDEDALQVGAIDEVALDANIQQHSSQVLDENARITLGLQKTSQEANQNTTVTDMTGQGPDMTPSKGGMVLMGKGRRKRKHLPASWSCPPELMKMKKRVLSVYDGPRGLWKDDMMLDNDSEVRILGDSEGPRQKRPRFI